MTTPNHDDADAERAAEKIEHMVEVKALRTRLNGARKVMEKIADVPSHSVCGCGRSTLAREWLAENKETTDEC